MTTKPKRTRTVRTRRKTVAKVTGGADPWEQQPQETAAAFRTFAAYRDSAPPRSIRRTAAHVGKDASQLARWSSDHGWQGRVAAWDREQDRVKRDAMLDEVVAMGQRQAQQAHSMQVALSMPAQELLRRIQKAREQGRDPFAGMTTMELMKAVAAAARGFSQVATFERLARGLSTSNVGGHDGGALTAGREHEEARAWAAAASRDELDTYLTGVNDGVEHAKREQAREAARKPRGTKAQREAAETSE